MKLQLLLRLLKSWSSLKETSILQKLSTWLERRITLHRNRRRQFCRRRQISRVDSFEVSEGRLQVFVLQTVHLLQRRSRLQVVVVFNVDDVTHASSGWNWFQEFFLLVIGTSGCSCVFVSGSEIDSDAHREVVLGALAAKHDGGWRKVKLFVNLKIIWKKIENFIRSSSQDP